jgi:HAD superfamily hydrolase (TIGR01549 family)
MSGIVWSGRVPVFDLDGTLLDSDDALAGAYLRLGVPESRITFGHVVAHECERLGLELADYLAAYDVNEAKPFAGVEALLSDLGRWAVCSNKDAGCARAELARLGWSPEAAWFAQDFEGGPKRLGPLLERLGLVADDVVFVGDSPHDAVCAAEVGCPFVVAAWNPRTRASGLLGDAVLGHPEDLAELLRP